VYHLQKVNVSSEADPVDKFPPSHLAPPDRRLTTQRHVRRHLAAVHGRRRLRARLHQALDVRRERRVDHHEVVDDEHRRVDRGAGADRALRVRLQLAVLAQVVGRALLDQHGVEVGDRAVHEGRHARDHQLVVHPFFKREHNYRERGNAVIDRGLKSRRAFLGRWAPSCRRRSSRRTPPSSRSCAPSATAARSPTSCSTGRRAPARRRSCCS